MDTKELLLGVLHDYLTPIVAKSVLAAAVSYSRADMDRLSSASSQLVMRHLDRGIRLYVKDARRQSECADRLSRLLGESAAPRPSRPNSFLKPQHAPRRVERTPSPAKPAARKRNYATTVPPEVADQHFDIAAEPDIVTARTAGRTFCTSLGFGSAGSMRVATAISELARNIVQHVGKGRIAVSKITHPRRGVEIVARDSGPGIPDLDQVLSGSYRTVRGQASGLTATRRLMDEFSVDTGPEKGTTVKVRKFL